MKRQHQSLLDKNSDFEFEEIYMCILTPIVVDHIITLIVSSLEILDHNLRREIVENHEQWKHKKSMRKISTKVTVIIIKF